MRQIYYFLLLGLALLSSLDAITAAFDPPEGWQYADTAKLPKSVKVMVVGPAKSDMPPSINLGYEPFEGTLKDYLKIVKEFNASQGDAWRDLGTIQTKAGPASLSQLDMKSKWGDLRMMHLIIKHDGIIYILTASSTKQEYSSYYPLFYKSFASLRFQEAS